MKYSGSLVKDERERIFELFLGKHTLKFNQIEKELGIRSNMVSYHLERMVKDGLLKKQGELYSLTTAGEKYIPIFSNVTGKELAATCALLVAVVNGKKVLLTKRDKRPYLGYFGVIGGKLQHGESISEGSLRLVKEKSGLIGKFISSNAVMHESVSEGDGIKHSFLLIFTKVEVKKALQLKDNFKWVSLDKVGKEKIIPSDEWLLRKKINSKANVIQSSIVEKNGEIASFKIK